jgi:hypothetical protein
MATINWSVINTALLLGAIGYLYRQARLVDQIRQALFGMDGQQGLIKQVSTIEADAKTIDKRIMETRHTIRNEFQGALLTLHDEIDKRLDRKQDTP